MNRREALAELKNLQSSGDIEDAHCKADSVLCRLLEEAGFADVVDEYEKIEKWYA